MRPFHFAFPVKDLEESRRFYCDVLGCKVGREAERWIDFDFGGNQISLHKFDAFSPAENRNHVDGSDVPVPHFGIILDSVEFDAMEKRLKAAQVKFDIDPRQRFAGKAGEQRTMFFRDPSGHALEIKSFADPSKIFETQS